MQPHIEVLSLFPTHCSSLLGCTTHLSDQGHSDTFQVNLKWYSLVFISIKALLKSLQKP